jgi:hypothetical protein
MRRLAQRGDVRMSTDQKIIKNKVGGSGAGQRFPGLQDNGLLVELDVLRMMSTPPAAARLFPYTHRISGCASACWSAPSEPAKLSHTPQLAPDLAKFRQRALGMSLGSNISKRSSPRSPSFLPMTPEVQRCITASPRTTSTFGYVSKAFSFSRPRST